MQTNPGNRIHVDLMPEWCRWAKLLLLVTLLFVIVPVVGFSNTITWDGNSPHCSGECCHDFTITITQPTDQVNIDLWDNTPKPPDCFDHACWNAQSSGTRQYVQGADGPWSFEIDINHSDPAWTGPFPVTIHVWICGTYDCMRQYDQWWWATRPFYEAGNLQPIYSGECYNPPPCGTLCSYLSVAPAGTPYVHCGTELCFHNQSGSLVTSFTLNFNPPLDLNNPCPGGPTGGPLCASNSNYNHTHVTFSSCGWTISSPDPSGNVTITSTNPACGVSNCNALCLFIPSCVTGYNDETISLVDPPNDGSCNSHDATVIAAMKHSDDGTVQDQSKSSAEQNYPNPIDANGGFKTVIPFTTSASGIASIRIVDATGKEVLSDNEDATYSGKHFFYLSADKLPSGTYYYTIEFPKGVVIASKTMLVVK